MPRPAQSVEAMTGEALENEKKGGQTCMNGMAYVCGHTKKKKVRWEGSKAPYKKKKKVCAGCKEAVVCSSICVHGLPSHILTTLSAAASSIVAGSLASTKPAFSLHSMTENLHFTKIREQKAAAVSHCTAPAPLRCCHSSPHHLRAADTHSLADEDKSCKAVWFVGLLPFSSLRRGARGFCQLSTLALVSLRLKVEQNR